MTRIRRFDALAGLLAAAAALGAAELMAGFTHASLIVAVGNAVVDYTPGPIVHRAIELLGHHDKPTVLWSVVVVSLLLGAALGPAAARRRWIGAVAFVGFALVGALAGARDPLTAAEIAFLNAGVAAVVGWIALQRLLDAAPRAAPELPPSAESEPAPAQMPGRGIGSRRRFLGYAAGTGGAAVVGAVLGRGIGGSSADVAAERQAIVLPTVVRTPPASVAGPAGSATATATPPPTERGFPIKGLSPLVTPNSDFYRIDTALVVPRVSTSNWQLTIKGMVDHPFTLTFDDLLKAASEEQPATLVCVSNEVGHNLAGNAVWQGVSLPSLLERAGLHAGASQVVGRSVDGFTVGFPTETALDGRPSMVAIAMNGEPLPAQHGFPARLIVPGLYGYVSATKWISEIELTRMDGFDAYWIPRGWSKLGPIKTESRIDVPRTNATVPPGKVTVAGVAWGGIRGISRVEVRAGSPADAGKPNAGAWHEARLGEELSNASWRQWVFDWDATPGDYLVEVRATDGDGQTQTAVRQAPAPNGATGYHGIMVKVQGA